MQRGGRPFPLRGSFFQAAAGVHQDLGAPWEANAALPVGQE